MRESAQCAPGVFGGSRLWSCRFATPVTVIHCRSTAYSAVTSHGKAKICPNGMDPKLCARDRRLPVENRRLLLVVWRHPGVDFTPPVIHTEPPVVDSGPPFFEIRGLEGPLGASGRQSEAWGRRLETLFRWLKACGRQSGAVNFEIGHLKMAESSPREVQSRFLAGA